MSLYEKLSLFLMVVSVILMVADIIIDLVKALKDKK